MSCRGARCLALRCLPTDVAPMRWLKNYVARVCLYICFRCSGADRWGGQTSCNGAFVNR